MGTPPFPSMGDLSDDEAVILRFVRDQLLQQASYEQITHNNPYLRAQIEGAAVVHDMLERLAERGYLERRTGRFGAGEQRTYAYRLTAYGEQALTDLDENPD